MRKATLSLLALGLAAAAPAAAQAAGVTVSYNVDVGPLTVTVVKFSVDVTGGEARARARIKAAGMSRVFSEFGATAEAETRLGDAAPEPVSYRITRDQSDMRKVTTLTWDGGTVTYDPPIKNSERKAKLDQALAGGVIDPVTAILRMGTLGDSPCPSTHEVFDGREVFELALTDKGVGKADGDSAWQGKVQRCSVRWTPIAGRSYDKGVPGDSYEVSFAPVAELENGHKLWLPVDMSGSLKGLGFKGYMTKVSNKAEAAAE
ncbi:MAG: DUF3108 domain-containing protein [Hyphomicrobiales bacterium]